MASIIKDRFKFRRKTSAEWTTLNEVLLEGEIGVVLGTNPVNFKIGDGVTAWNGLEFLNGDIQLEVEAIEQDILAINQDIAIHETELVEHEVRLDDIEDDVLFENKQAFRDFFKRLYAYSLSSNTLFGITGWGDSMSEGLPLRFTKRLNSFFPKAGLVSTSFGLAEGLSNYAKTGAVVYDGRILTANIDASNLDFTYVPNANHVELADGATLIEGTGQATGFSTGKAIFATGPDMGSVFVELLNKDTGSVISSTTLNLSNSTIGATKAEFALTKAIKYNIRVTATGKVVYLLSAFLKTGGFIPFHFGKGGTTYAQNNSSNKAILSYLISEFSISLVISMVKEAVPSTSIDATMDTFNTYFPNASKLILSSLPDVRDSSIVIEENRVLRKATLDNGFSFFDAYKANKDYAELVRLGQNGDGTHPTAEPYEYVAMLIFTELGLSNAVGTVEKREINHVDSLNTVVTNKLIIPKGDSSGDLVEVVIKAGGADPSLAIIQNLRKVVLGGAPGLGNPALIKNGNMVYAVDSSNDAATGMKAKFFDAIDASSNNSFAGPVVGKNFKVGNIGPTWSAGTGSPEGVVVAITGSIYSRTDGGAGITLYVKESGAGNTGWTAK